MKKQWIKTTSIPVLLFFLVGCAALPANISPTYVPPLKYSNYTCKQLSEEYDRLGGKLTELTKKQKNSAGVDIVAMSVGMILFWPALFFLIGGDHEVELAQISGDYEAIETAAIERGCDCVEAMQKNREKREEKKAEREEGIENRDW